MPPIFRTPTTFLSLFLGTFLLQFLDFLDIYAVQIGIQLGLLATALLYPPWRSSGTILLAAFAVGYIPWINMQKALPQTCQKGIDTISAEITRSSFDQKGFLLRLHKVEVVCSGEEFVRPIGVVYLKGGIKKRKFGWFQVGDRVILSGVEIHEIGPLLLSLREKDQLHIENLTKTEDILRRSSLLLYLQNKARFYLQAFPFALFRSLVTGDRSSVGREWKVKFQELGISHLFAISGMHLGVLYVWGVLGVGKLALMGAGGISAGRHLLWVDAAVLLGICAYLWLIGLPISALRAVLMLAWWMVARHFFPWQPLHYILLAVAALILSQNPLAIAQLSFQLSFLSVLGILLLLPHLPSPSLSGHLWQRIGKSVVSLLLISTWLMIFTAPIVGFLASKQSFLAPFSNLFHILFMGWIYLPIAMVVAGLTLFFYPWGGFWGEFALFSLINFLGRFWEWSLIWNHRWNQLWLYKTIPFESPVWAASYWAVLIVFIKVLVPLISKKLKTAPIS